MTFTMEEKRRAIERELNHRHRVYPSRVMNHRMSQKLANEQIAIFEEILQDYRQAETKEKLL
jgi:hypothetical protein